MSFPLRLAALPLLLISTAAYAAEPATPEGAAELTTLLQTYLGAKEGVVSVEPGDEVYDVTLDFAPLTAGLPAGTTTVSPLEFTLADNGDGTWAMTQDQALSLKLSIPGEIEMDIAIASYKGEGVFDEALQTFSSSNAEFSGLTMTQKVTDPNMGQQNVSYAIADGSYESTGAAGENGGVDSTGSFTLNGLSESFDLPPMGEGAPPSTISLTVDSYVGDSAVTGLRPDALYKLLAFFVANPSEEAIKAAQGELKTILTDGLPLFEHVTSNATGSNLKVQTPMGEVAASEVSATIEAGGLVEEGLFREAIGVKGLALPAGLVPDWAVDLVPKDVALDFAASRFDLAAPAKIFLAAMDLTKPEPVDEATGQQMLAALLPEGVVDITIAPSAVTAPIYTLSLEGTATAGPAAMPTGKATLTATGITAVEQALAKAPPEVGGQANPMIAMVKGLSKPGADGALVWELEMTADGKMLVNGTDLSAMGMQ